MPRFKIPLKDSLVIGHMNPDGDSLSSIKAVMNYLESNGCNSYTKIVGPVPEHLSWIINDEDLREIPVNQTIVLDCGPEEERTGVKIDGPIINIDHHHSRINKHNIKNKFYILERCSTASILILDFGIIDPVLLVGLYFDTMFVKSWTEIVKCFKILNVDDKTAEKILSSIKPTKYINALMSIKNAKLHKCRNGFLIVETEESDPLVVSEMMDISFRYAESVCLVDGNGNGKLRTSNENLKNSGKLLEIANLFDGGGHNFASGMDVSNRKTALFSLVRQLKTEPNKINLDGYEESHDKSNESSV